MSYCRICGDEEPHQCRYTHAEPMSERDELALLALLNTTRWDFWSASEHEFSTDEFRIGGWSVWVFFDGCEAEDWDYIDHVVAPDGRSYASWPSEHERYALPSSIVHWRPLTEVDRK